MVSLSRCAQWLHPPNIFLLTIFFIFVYYCSYHIKKKKKKQLKKHYSVDINDEEITPNQTPPQVPHVCTSDTEYNIRKLYFVN